MKSIVIRFLPREKLMLPTDHFDVLQGLIYTGLLSFDPGYAAAIHNKTRDGKAAKKLFCFSGLQDLQARGRIDETKKTVTFDGPCALEIRAADDRFIDIIEARLRRKPGFLLNNWPCRVTETETAARRFFGERMAFRMSTPITEYRTEFQPEKKRTIYYSPEEPEFYDRVEKNLKDKYREVFQTEYTGALSFERLRKDSEVCKTAFDGFSITGYYGTYQLTGAPDILAVAYYCGLGAKSSQGFGMISPDMLVG